MNFRTSRLFFISSIMLILLSCNTPLSLSSRKSPHEKYADGLKDAGLANSSLARSWLNAAEKGLNQPVTISIPYREQGFFPAETPAAAGFRFTAKRGEVININLVTTPASGYKVFMEIWHGEGTSRELLSSTDSLPGLIRQEIKSDGNYILRLQPELLQPVGYTLSITTSPSLAFPVREEDNPKASSFWGAARDGGGRSHEGVDIFAKKGTDAIAIAEGRVTRVNQNQLGGKVVFMRPDGADYSLYYAHLDSQLVSEGQRVSPGDVIGHIGNTGNARTTPAHLHFGIYTNGGAVDPWPFINVNTAKPKNITGDTSMLNNMVRTTSVRSASATNGPAIESGTGLTIVAASSDQYRVRLPDGNETFLPARNTSSQPVRVEKTKQELPLQTAPMAGSAVRRLLTAGTSVSVLATWSQYNYVRSGNEHGWIPKQ